MTGAEQAHVTSPDRSPSPLLVRTSLAKILTFWVPGSHDWTWAEEYRDLIDDPVTARVRARVDAEGIGFSDHAAPVLLGSDGRVWDGHHRIVIAIDTEISHLMVELAALDQSAAADLKG